MAFAAILIAIAMCIFQTPWANCQTTSPWVDPFVTGQRGNPGARIHLNNKTIDAVHSYAAEKIAESLRSVIISEFELNIGNGNLLIKPPRITEAKFAKSEYQLMPPNRILSRFYGGKLIGSGIWQYKKHGASSPISGTYKATITNIDVNATIQLSRTYEGKPMAQVVECKVDLSQHLIELEGAPDLKKVENCKTAICLKISAYFEDAVCKMVESFVKDVINFHLQKFPAKQRGGVLFSWRTEPYQVDYSLLANEPKVTEYDIRAGLEGKFVWRGASVVPFNPSPLNWIDRNRMLSFVMGDYTFNTLLHQAHVAGYKFSAAELLPQSSELRQLLRLNCDGKPFTTTATTPKTRRVGSGQPATKAFSGPQCLGQLFENFTSFGPYSSEDMGDVVYRCMQKPKAVYIQSDKEGYFDGSNGALEILGPAAKDGSRKVLARADVRLLRGDFMPKLNGANITGSVKINSVQLAQAPAQNRMITDEWLDKLALFFGPVATQSINAFFDQYAQFPIPLPEAYVCASPEFLVSNRTMQIDCDIKESNRSTWVCYWVDEWVCGWVG